MDPILERFNRLIRSIFADTEDIDFHNYEFSGDHDNDYSQAWEELNDFLAYPERETRKNTSYTDDSKSEIKPPEILKQDYKNLGVPFGTDFNDIQKSYKKLLIKHHPDKNSSTRESIQRSTEITKTLNVSFQRINAWELAKKGYN